MAHMLKKFFRFAIFRVLLLQLILLVLIIFSPFRGMAQQARLKFDTDSIAMGKRAVLTIEIDAPANSVVFSPTLSDTLSQKLELISFKTTDTILLNNEMHTLRQEILVTAWEPGFVVIPHLPFKAITNGDTLLFESEPLMLYVQGVEIGEEATPFDIKPILKMPVSLLEIFKWWLPISFITGLIIGFTFWYLKRRKNRPVSESIWEKPEIPPHIAAISSLESLKNKKLWQSGKVKLYHSELTFILRMYLEKRFNIIALEMTSSEILQLAPRHIKEEESLESLKYIFELADLVKFAKFEPEVQQNEECIELALEFVKRNIPQTVVKEKGPGEKNN
jgi:hypothetical protein